MLTDKLKNHINIQKNALNWQEAIKTVAQPLLDEECIKPEYIDAMIQNVKDNGDYIIIVPGFAMPHASPECGALKNGMSLLKLEEPVVFPEGEKVKLFIALAAQDANAHLDILAELADVLVDDERMEQLLKCNDQNKILGLLQ